MKENPLLDFFELNNKDNCIYFKGDNLKCYIPRKYEKKEYLIIHDKVSALGIFDICVNDKYEGGIQIPAVITLDPVDMYDTTIDDVKYLTCELTRGSQFITDLDVLQNNDIPYYMWTEYLSLGNLPRYLGYDDCATLFDTANKFSGKGLEANHAVYELIISYMFRDKKSINTFFRHTDMKDEPQIVNIRDIAHSATTTHSRIIGSYGDAGRTSALLNQSEENHPLEDLFRA